MTDDFSPPGLVVSMANTSGAETPNPASIANATLAPIETATPTTTNKRASSGKRSGGSRKRTKRGSNANNATKNAEEVVNVAAHLTLLGDSLNAIGDRLREQQVHGPVALGSALSVLLDSLLCSLAPLVTLTRQLDALNGADEDTINTLLDDIAFIMPGL